MLPDAAWTDYQLDADKEALATKQALFFRSVFMPSLASALTRVRDGDAEALRSFADRLQEGLTRRLASQPLRQTRSSRLSFLRSVADPSQVWRIGLDFKSDSSFIPCSALLPQSLREAPVSKHRLGGLPHRGIPAGDGRVTVS